MSRIGIFLSVIILMFSTQTMARDVVVMVDVADTLDKWSSRFSGDVKFYFGKQSYPTPQEVLTEEMTNKKTNAFNKSDEEACDWVLLSALLKLEEAAKKRGGNAVVDIVSYYKKNTFSSETEVECHAGNVVAGVALKGKVVKLPKK